MKNLKKPNLLKQRLDWQFPEARSKRWGDWIKVIKRLKLPVISFRDNFKRLTWQIR